MLERPAIISHLINNLEPKQSNSNSQDTLKESGPRERSIVLKKVNIRTFNKLMPIDKLLGQHHVYRLFNTFGLNQAALRNPDYEENFFKTYFYHKIITKTEKYQQAVVISVSSISNAEPQADTGYIIEKLKSFGDSKLNGMAGLIEDLWKTLKEASSRNAQSVIKEEKQSITKIISDFGDEMYVCKFGIDKMVVSDSLLTYLGYDVNEFAIETVKYRTVLFDFLSASSYFLIANHSLQCVKYLIDFNCGKIPQEEFQKLCRLQFKDYIYTRHNVKSYCEMELFIIQKILCLKIKKVIYEVDQLRWKPYGSSDLEYQNEKARVNQKEHQLLHKLNTYTRNGQKIVAGYKNLKNNDHQ